MLIYCCVSSFKFLYYDQVKDVPSLIAHVESSSMFMGIANLECAVLPPGSKSDAIPLEATLRTMSPLERSAAESDLQIKVLPVPPYP